MNELSKLSVEELWRDHCRMENNHFRSDEEAEYAHALNAELLRELTAYRKMKAKAYDGIHQVHDPKNYHPRKSSAPEPPAPEAEGLPRPIEMLKRLLEACERADEEGDLSEFVSGEILDQANAVLRAAKNGMVGLELCDICTRGPAPDWRGLCEEIMRRLRREHKMTERLTAIEIYRGNGWREAGGVLRAAKEVEEG